MSYRSNWMAANGRMLTAHHVTVRQAMDALDCDEDDMDCAMLHDDAIVIDAANGDATVIYGQRADLARFVARLAHGLGLMVFDQAEVVAP